MAESIHGYRKIKNIGKGGFGTVYLVTKGGQRYALKEIVQDAESEKEVQILKKLKHRNIVSYIESFSGGSNKMYIVMEYCEMGNLRELIISKDPIGVEERFIVGIMTQVCRGMKYIHRRKVIHRDIKPPNIFVTSRGDFKIGDFGLSKVLQSGEYAMRRCGTRGYTSPECLAGLPYTFSSDMWAVGKVLSDLLNYKGIQHYSNDLRALHLQLLSTEPRKRPTADEALSMLSNVNSASKGRQLSRAANSNGYSKDLRTLLGKLQTDPSYQPTPNDILTVFLNLKLTSSKSSSSESSYGAYCPKYVSQRSPRNSSSSESSDDTLGMEMMSLNAPKKSSITLPRYDRSRWKNVSLTSPEKSSLTLPRYDRSRWKNVSLTSPENYSSSESRYDACGPNDVSQRAPRNSSSSESSDDTLGMEMMSLNAPGVMM